MIRGAKNQHAATDFAVRLMLVLALAFLPASFSHAAAGTGAHHGKQIDREHGFPHGFGQGASGVSIHQHASRSSIEVVTPADDMAHQNHTLIIAKVNPHHQSPSPDGEENGPCCSSFCGAAMIMVDITNAGSPSAHVIDDLAHEFAVFGEFAALRRPPRS